MSFMYYFDLKLSNHVYIIFYICIYILYTRVCNKLNVVFDTLSPI